MMNQHTPGPYRHEGIELIDGLSDGQLLPHAVIRSPDERWVALVEVGDAEGEANARLVPAALNAFDKAGRALGVDAAELAAQIDLVALIRSAVESTTPVVGGCSPQAKDRLLAAQFRAAHKALQPIRKLIAHVTPE